MTDRPQRRRDAVNEVFFGEELPPRVAPDERDEASPPEDEAERDRWLRENRPPHHL